MKTLTVYPENPNQRHISEAAEVLRRGEIIIYPTDTVYAFGCDALNNRAIERLCRIKEINPDKHLLSIVCADLSMASEYARIDNHAFRILKRCLPGAYTFILPAATTLPKAFKGRKSVGVRIPDNRIARALAAELGHPLLSTSVPSGGDEGDEVSPGVIAFRYGRGDAVVLLIDGGEGGTVPGTVVDLTDSTDPVVVRQGVAIFN